MLIILRELVLIIGRSSQIQHHHAGVVARVVSVLVEDGRLGTVIYHHSLTEQLLLLLVKFLISYLFAL